MAGIRGKTKTEFITVKYGGKIVLFYVGVLRDLNTHARTHTHTHTQTEMVLFLRIIRICLKYTVDSLCLDFAYFK